MPHGVLGNDPRQFLSLHFCAESALAIVHAAELAVSGTESYATLAFAFPLVRDSLAEALGAGRCDFGNGLKAELDEDAGVASVAAGELEGICGWWEKASVAPPQPEGSGFRGERGGGSQYSMA